MIRPDSPYPRREVDDHGWARILVHRSDPVGPRRSYSRLRGTKTEAPLASKRSTTCLPREPETPGTETILPDRFIDRVRCDRAWVARCRL